MAPEQTAPLRVRMEAGRVGGEKQNLSLEGKTRERLKCLPLVGNDHYGQGRERKMLTRGGPLMEAATVSERCFSDYLNRPEQSDCNREIGRASCRERGK